MSDAPAGLLDVLPDAVVELDDSGTILGWRAGAERVFGWRASDVVGRPLALLFAARAEADLELALDAAGTGSLDLLTTCRRRQGGDFPAAISLRRGRAGCVALVKPVGAGFEGHGRSSTPEWDRALGRLVAGISQIAGTDLAAIERTDALARVLVEEARRLIPESQVLFSLVPHHRQDSFRIIAGAGPWAEDLVGREWLRTGTVAGRAMQLRRPVETIALSEASVLRPLIEPGGILAARLVPLWTREPLPDGRDAIGVLGWYRSEARWFTPRDRRLMRELCRLASLMLQRTELSAAAARSVQRLQAVVDAARDLTRSLDPAQILEVLIDRGRALTASDRAAALRVESGRLTVVAGSDTGADPPSAGAVLPVDSIRADDGTPLLERVLAEGALALRSGYRVEGMPSGLDRHPVSHSAGVPVGIAGQPSLVLLFSRRRDEAFTADDLSLLETMAAIAGLALRNASLFVQVESADRVKTDFLEMAAHELRTPLTVIRGYLSMMVDGSFGEAPKSWLAPLRTLLLKCDELGRLVEELLLAARLETGAVAVSTRPLDLNELAGQAVDAARPRARAREARLRFEPARRPLVVSADPEHLLRLLDALLSNAIAYSDDEPWVRVRVRAAPGGVAEVEIEDRGRGIAAEHHDSVFERFVRLASDDQPAGTGLGLHIARALAERQNGRLVLDWSEPGHGSRFVLALPELGTHDGD